MKHLIANKKKENNKIILEIDKDNFETFCSTIKLFKKKFLQTLYKSLEDHNKGRITKRKSLKELID